MGFVIVFSDCLLLNFIVMFVCVFVFDCKGAKIVRSAPCVLVKSSVGVDFRLSPFVSCALQSLVGDGQSDRSILQEELVFSKILNSKLRTDDLRS